MNNPSLPESRSWSPALALRVECVCQSFEAACKTGQRPQIEEFLEETTEPERSVLLRELLGLELDYCRRRDERPNVEDYLVRFPQDAEVIRALFREGVPSSHPLPDQPNDREMAQVAPAQETVQDPNRTSLYTPPSPVEADPPTLPPKQRAADAPSPGPPPVPGYTLLGELGRGGMGVVYKARHTALKRLVALKMILAGGYAGSAELARFRSEAEAVARLQHPGIVQIYEVGEVEGRPFFALEFVAGGSLASHLDGTPLPVRTAAQLVEKLAQAMEAAHQSGIVHRDLKPANVLLAPIPKSEIRNPKQMQNPQEEHPKPDSKPVSDLGNLGLGIVSDFGFRIADFWPKVTDFGLAKKLDEAGQTQSGAIMGTPSYMAPEQAGGKSSQIGPAADVYALGAILYELVTGQPPFRAETPLDTLMQVVSEEPVPPSQLNPKVPRDLETICLKCLQKEPGKRYTSAEELGEDLRRFQAEESILGRRVGRWEKAGKWVRRHRGVAVLLGCMLLAVGVAGFFAYQVMQGIGRLAAEKRQAALEKALVGAMSGDFDEADKAIHEAEQHGASPGQIHLLNAQVAYYRGQEAKSIKHLEQAIELLPDSAAARGLLAVAYGYAGRGNDMARVIRELEPIAPVTLEDYLFKGAAIGQFDPERGLKLLDEAVRRRPISGIARVFRADIRCQLAQDRGDPREADLAIADADIAKNRLPEKNPVALWESTWVHQVAAGVYRAAGLQEKYRSALAQAEKDAGELKAFPNLPNAVVMRACYFWYYGQKDRTLNELRRLVRQTGLPGAASLCATILCWRGAPVDLEAALAILEAHRGNQSSDQVRCCVLAQLNRRAAALDTQRRMIAGNLEGYYRLRSYTVLLLLGKKDEVKALCRQDRQQLNFLSRQQGFNQKLHDYLAGEVSKTGLLKAAAASRSRWNECFAHYAIGLAHLADGDRIEARKHLEKVIATRTIGLLNYDLSMVLLRCLEKDPSWPPWIK